MGKSLIRLRDVWKIYHMGEVDVPALRGVDLEIGDGEFVAIIGPSGSGKSTIMNLVGCLDLPTRGSIHLEGDDINELKESNLAQIRGRKIGFVFQQFNLIPTLSALENVMLPLEFLDVATSDAKEKAKGLLDLVGLSGRSRHLPTQLSGGEMQRVAIARALSADPDIILADEPTGNLDSRTGIFILDFLRKIHREQGKTIIIVTHDLKLAKYAERVIHLMDGKVAKIEKRGRKHGKKN